MSDPLLAFHGAARAVTGSCFRLTTGTGSCTAVVLAGAALRVKDRLANSGISR